MTLGLVVLLAAAMPACLCAAQQSAEPRPRDAAEAVREGDVSQWLKYYQRERALQVPAQQPAPTSESVTQSTPSGEPATQQQQEDAAGKR